MVKVIKNRVAKLEEEVYKLREQLNAAEHKSLKLERENRNMRRFIDEIRKILDYKIVVNSAYAQDPNNRLYLLGAERAYHDIFRVIKASYAFLRTLK